jgi:glycosyltransferase involved in cell wall biosynthesis
MRPAVHAFFSSIYTFLKRSSFDIVMTRNIYYALLSTKLGIPTIYEAHHPPKNKAAHLSFKAVAGSGHLISFVTISQALANQFLELGLSPEKLLVLHDGVDLERFYPALSKEEAKSRTGLPLGQKIVCYCGHLYEGRGIDLLLEASLRLKDVLFIVVGGMAKDIERYREMARVKDARNFILKGFVPYAVVPAYLFAADLLVMPYTSRMTDVTGRVVAGFTSPIKMFEYMASERPIVATKLPPIEEVLKDGENAILVEPDNLAALISGIEKALNAPELCDKLASRAASQVKSYTWKERAITLLKGISN